MSWTAVAAALRRHEEQVAPFPCIRAHRIDRYVLTELHPPRLDLRVGRERDQRETRDAEHTAASRIGGFVEAPAPELLNLPQCVGLAVDRRHSPGRGWHASRPCALDGVRR